MTLTDLAIDAKPTLEKEKYLREAAITSWMDLVCADCGNRCCAPCTAGGDYMRCAYTTSQHCSVCSHPSSRHFAEPHQG